MMDDEQKNPMRDAMVAAYEQLEQHLANDPLLKAGVGRDWQCVISPALVNPLLHEFEQMPGFVETTHYLRTPYEKLRVITGRSTWIINDAPRDRLEYMPASELLRRYGKALGEEDYKLLEMIAD